MKKLIYTALVVCLVCVAVADDHIIQFVVNGYHYSYRTSDIKSITYDYHDQDSIDQAYRDSIARDQFVRDSIAREEFVRDSLYKDSVMKWNDAHTLPKILEEASEYSIFAEALRLTGLCDSVVRWEGERQNPFVQLPRINYSSVIYSDISDSTPKVGYTLFAETDEVMRANGINSFEDLVAFANKTYGSASEWYDYLRVNGLSVSTSDDYTNRLNALNMFVAYHIVGAQMNAGELVFEKRPNMYWNYAPDADPYDYYETMLPHTMLKVWEPASLGNRLFINRYQTNNTLTNEVGTMGTNHQVVREGVQIDRSNTLEASNAYIYPINGMLVYDELVPRGVLNERMRVNCTSLFPELITNGYRSWSYGDGNIPSNYDYSRVGIPMRLSGNVVHYETSVISMTYCIHYAWRYYQSDGMQMWGDLDFAVKLPPVPAGVYELRMAYAPLPYAQKIELSLGTNPYAPEAFELLDTLDYSIYLEDPEIGMTNPLEEEDLGIASDKQLRERGYMRAPYSFCGHAENGWSLENNCRNEYNSVARKIVNRVQMDGQSQWLRIKTVSGESFTSMFLLDYIELCPVSVCDNTTYMEDWY